MLKIRESSFVELAIMHIWRFYFQFASTPLFKRSIKHLALFG